VFITFKLQTEKTPVRVQVLTVLYMKNSLRDLVSRSLVDVDQRF
jgi:hypothetical protein